MGERDWQATTQSQGQYLVSYAAKTDLGLMQKPVAHPAGKALLKQIKA